jgi:NAD(P)-dependent dehydrogenase (short-subunit alcohol dehydrogenase family)
MSSQQRIALITGGNRGIGRNAALALARDGVDSVITYRTHPEEAEAVVAELRALGRDAAALQLEVGDVSTFDAFAEALTATLLETWGRDTFDYLVNNAGNGSTTGLAEVTEEEFDRLIDIHYKGPLFLTQRLVDLIADEGSIVNVSSTLVRVTWPKRIAYASVKGAVEVLSRYMAAELGPRGINVNTVAPGAVATDFNDGVVRSTPAMQEALAGITALGRYAVADDIGPVIASLLSDSNRFVTGQRVEASGGMHV